MKSITATFTLAARTAEERRADRELFWLMVIIAIAIIDDSERREKEQHRKNEAAKGKGNPKPKLKPPGCGWSLGRRRQMSRKPKRAREAEEHAIIAVRVEGYEMSVETRVNLAARQPEYALDFDERDPLYPVTSKLVITGTIAAPKDRAGHRCEITFYGDDAPSGSAHATLKDAQVRDDKYGSPQYREYRGRHVPIVKPPKGLAVFEKARGENRWTAAFFVLRTFVTYALMLLAHGKPLFINIHEIRRERTRWARSVSLQTTDPEEE